MSLTKLTPRQIARRWGISPSKVVRWIQSGELRAIDGSTARAKRPRYLVDIQDLAEFERSRLVCRGDDQ
jgi:excisionase family DNA binding protein